MLSHTVADVMTREVLRVDPDTQYKDIVDLLVGHAVSAVPVVDNAGTVLGVVSEVDLLYKQKHHGERERPAALAPGKRMRREWRKTSGLTARDLMTSPAATIDGDVPLPEAAARLERSGLRRLIVVDDGRLVGILARRDLLRDFLRKDSAIRREIEEELYDRRSLADPRKVRITVDEGVVWLSGRITHQGDVAVAESFTRNVTGVVAVRNLLDFVKPGFVR